MTILQTSLQDLAKIGYQQQTYSQYIYQTILCFWIKAYNPTITNSTSAFLTMSATLMQPYFDSKHPFCANKLPFSSVLPNQCTHAPVGVYVKTC